MYLRRWFNAFGPHSCPSDCRASYCTCFGPGSMYLANFCFWILNMLDGLSQSKSPFIPIAFDSVPRKKQMHYIHWIYSLWGGFSVATCFFDSARLLCVAIICQFYDPKSGSVLIGRFLRFLQDEMLFASFCPIPSVGDAVYFPGQSARPLTELNIRRTEGKIWCHCVCVFLFFLAHLLHILCSFASAWTRCGVWPWSANISDAPLHSCCTFSCENPTHQHLQCPSAPRCKVVAQASGLCGPRTNSVWCQCFGQCLLNAFCRSLQTASVSVQVTSLEPLSACINCAFAINLKRLHEVSRFVVKGLVWTRRRRNCFCWPSGEM